MKKIRDKNITKFLNNWDKEIYDLNVMLKEMNRKQKKEILVPQINKANNLRLSK